MDFVEELKNHKLILEVLTPSQRIKLKNSLRKNKNKIALGRKKAAKKIASPEKLKARSVKKARGIAFLKLSGGKKKEELSLAQRGTIEKKLVGKKGKIQKLAKKLLPEIKKKEKAKFQKNKNPDQG